MLFVKTGVAVGEDNSAPEVVVALVTQQYFEEYKSWRIHSTALYTPAVYLIGEEGEQKTYPYMRRFNFNSIELDQALAIVYKATNGVLEDDDYARFDYEPYERLFRDMFLTGAAGESDGSWVDGEMYKVLQTATGTMGDGQEGKLMYPATLQWDPSANMKGIISQNLKNAATKFTIAILKWGNSAATNKSDADEYLHEVVGKWMKGLAEKQKTKVSDCGRTVVSWIKAWGAQWVEMAV